jgi:hypothetical protein
MKKIILATSMLLAAQASFAGFYKCTLTSQINQGDSVRKIVGYVNSSDSKDLSKGVSLAQLELNARNGSVQPYAAITAFENRVVVQILETRIDNWEATNQKTGKKVKGQSIAPVVLSALQDTSATAVDKQGNTHKVSCIAF